VIRACSTLPQRAGQLAERDTPVDARFTRKPEHALADGVALYLVGSAADLGSPLVEERMLPSAVVDGI
jgi:hypothetical protein